MSITLKSRSFLFSIIDGYIDTVGYDQNKFIQSLLIDDEPCDYAFICHDKDKTEHVHWHYFIRYKTPRAITSVANYFKIPVNMIQICHSDKAFINYLTHENNPEKYHYDLSNVISNFDVKLARKAGKVDVLQEYKDFHNMSIEEYLSTYSDEIGKCNLYNRLRIYTMLQARGACLRAVSREQARKDN